MTDNMKIWNAVSETKPSQTKKVRQGARQFTAIDAYSQIEAATEQFGPVGKGWGWRILETGKLESAAFVLMKFWWKEEEEIHDFEVFGGSKFLKNDGKPFDPDEAYKKALTDAITKALSYLGFNADVFTGKFDDNKYVQERKQEEQAEVSSADAAKADVEWATNMISKIDKIRSVDELHRAWEKLKPMLETKDGTAALMITDRIELKKLSLGQEKQDVRN